jgi:predicted nucleic acid-binding protein
VIICDTGPLVAAALANDADHLACVELFTSMHGAGRELLIPATVVAEVGYLLAREAGPRVESSFLLLRPRSGPALQLPESVRETPLMTVLPGT